MNETLAPPTEAMRERRDTEWLRVTQLRYSQGFKARLAEMHPAIKDKQGKITQRREPKWQFGKDVAQQRCPNGVEEKRSPKGGIVRPREVWPEHERERWVAGWVHCDTICAERGLAAARLAEPTRVPRKRAVTLAEPVEMFPDAILTREAAREHSARMERIRHGRHEHQFNLPDSEDA